MSDERENTAITDSDADELVDLIDNLMSSGSQHVNIDIGDVKKVRTVNSTDCGKAGPCSLPSTEYTDRE
ncbi:MAG: hypothetical protein J6X60_02315 [Ruminiclostridium sp.]|nr:hypothetical protein [Ruminiclostridium sp.]